MATLSAGAASTPQPVVHSTRNSMDNTDRAFASRLTRCRQWLHLRRNMQYTGGSGCPDIYDTSIGLPSPTSTTVMSECFSTGESSSSGDASSPASTAFVDGDIGYQQANSAQPFHVMHARWSGCLAQTLSSRQSVGSARRVNTLRSRSSAVRGEGAATAANAHCLRTAGQSSHPGSGGSVCSLAFVGHSGDAATDIVALASSAIAEAAAVEILPMPTLPEEHSNNSGSWECACVECAEAVNGDGSGSSSSDIIPERRSSLVYNDTPYTAVDDHAAFPQHYLHAQPHMLCRGRYHTFSGDYSAADSEYAEYSHSSLPPNTNVHVMAPEVPEHPPVATPDSTTSGLQSATIPSASVIAHIFSIGEPTQQPGHKGISRASRLTRRIRGLVSRKIKPDTVWRRQARACSEALLDALAAESTFASSIRVLSRTRSSAQSPSFCLRADRVHLNQSRLLRCIHVLFMLQVPAEERRSRHYRFYLPEDDQLELDRGFSESVLFAAQALARGYQIRGTELQTQALREPAWLLCSVWAAVRHVIYSRGGELWSAWNSGPEQDHEEELQALKRVLLDFDEAWVRFERDLCFAYFGLGNAQLANMLGDSEDDEGRVAQEEEFSLLVVLLSETLQRCRTLELVTEEQIEAMDPQFILALPRLAIIHAIGRGGVEGLCFVESEDGHQQAGTSDHAAVFWWFREYAEQCRRISDTLARWPDRLFNVLQMVLVAEEADVALAGAEDILSDMLQVAAELDSQRVTADLESMIDGPRSARSMSIDCISSICAPPLLCTGRAHAKSFSADPDFDECLSARLHAAYAAAPPSPMILTPPDSLQLYASTSVSGELVGSLSFTTSGSSAKMSWPRPLSPVAAGKSLPGASLGVRGMDIRAARVAREAERRAKLDELMADAKQIYVDVCTVSDSLHSGPFARPFRVALEMVFRMNTEE